MVRHIAEHSFLNEMNKDDLCRKCFSRTQVSGLDHPQPKTVLINTKMCYVFCLNISFNEDFDV